MTTSVGIHDVLRPQVSGVHDPIPRDRRLDCARILDPTWAVYRVVGRGYVCLACGRERIERMGLVFVQGAHRARR